MYKVAEGQTIRASHAWSYWGNWRPVISTLWLEINPYEISEIEVLIHVATHLSLQSHAAALLL